MRKQLKINRGSLVIVSHIHIKSLAPVDLQAILKIYSAVSKVIGAPGLDHVIAYLLKSDFICRSWCRRVQGLSLPAQILKITYHWSAEYRTLLYGCWRCLYQNSVCGSGRLPYSSTLGLVFAVIIRGWKSLMQRIPVPSQIFVACWSKDRHWWPVRPTFGGNSPLWRWSSGELIFSEINNDAAHIASGRI